MMSITVTNQHSKSILLGSYFRVQLLQTRHSTYSMVLADPDPAPTTEMSEGLI